MIRNTAWRRAARNARPTRGMFIAAGTLWLGFTVGAVMPLAQAVGGHQAPGVASLGQSVAVTPVTRTVPLKPSTGIGTAVHKLASETRAEMQCKDVASEGDETGVAAAFRRCELLYGPLAHRMTRCEEEDGSGRGQALPCRWNDRVIGVSSGFSFVVTQNPASRDGRCFTYDDPKVDARYGGCEL